VTLYKKFRVNVFSARGKGNELHHGKIFVAYIKAIFICGTYELKKNVIKEKKAADDICKFQTFFLMYVSNVGCVRKVAVHL
jgi:hypothetical protein